ncbi:bifunctional transcriptional activator/DNA repair enzyme AdaA [Dysgonomonas macrotermitis]|uniref:Methylated-DNA--protein-cysteine methyltransferase n=1 Tax=Dysgonomonas macrotermitis TaxID=1346286 RepID=A0A1M5FK40_9BACT|nr:bifunctional transcriptional activator/DNA repair protein Ada [Dysgonomonas macrotermitis]SHF91890.1 AraC family transcriptional regulator, regulatory protein of adaptative response / methylated-DNA-[protein]-cysteine methyltransferase [Dysgonomonas macrotermitis]
MDNDDIFYKALVEKDSTFEGVFIVGVKTTGIFCRPTCNARKPKRENVEFFPSTKEAIQKGYRACKVCHPMETPGHTPDYIHKVLSALSVDPTKKLKDWDIRSMDIEPSQVRRWFQHNHGITFHAYQRMFRINQAFKRYKEGNSVTDIAFESGYESLSGFNESFKKLIGTSPQNSLEVKVINLTRIETPLGTMIACATDKGICLLEFSDRKMLETEFKILTKSLKAPIIQGENKHFVKLREQLGLYFSGKLQTFDIPLDTIGTDFQKQVWDILMKIPYGTTASYAEQAHKLGNPAAIRAVANANGMNKISIIIPCHRVIGSDGSLTGYGGGLWRKKKLLDLEQENL